MSRGGLTGSSPLVGDTEDREAGRPHYCSAKPSKSLTRQRAGSMSRDSTTRKA